jgi:hypothetical protein
MSPTDSLTHPPPIVDPAAAAPGRRVGYVASIVINLVLLWVVHHLLEWGWPRFLTDDFEDVLPILTLSIVASIAANVLFVVVDADWFQHLCNLVTAAIAVAVGIVTYQVFPFDFADYATDWAWLARLLIVLGTAGTAIAVVVNAVSLVVDAVRAWRPTASSTR